MSIGEMIPPDSPFRTGNRFSRLTVISISHRRSGNQSRLMVDCLCECGRTTQADSSNLKSGHTKSCGCLGKTYHVKHGACKTPEYRAWAKMLARCRNPKDPNFMRYGGRGITVCERWNNFQDFIADMGARPSSFHSIERINNNEGYSPDNCKWATRPEQQRNRRNNIRITFNGETLVLQDWAKKVGIRPQSLLKRINKGWDLERAMTTPAQNNGGRIR